MPSMGRRDGYLIGHRGAICYISSGERSPGLGTETSFPTGATAEQSIYGQIIPVDRTCKVEGFGFWTGTAAPAGASRAFRIGLYSCDQATARPLLKLAETEFVAADITASTVTWIKKALSAAVLLKRPELYAVCLQFANSAFSGGNALAHQNSWLPGTLTRTPGEPRGVTITRAVAFSYAEGLPADFSAEVGLTWSLNATATMSQVLWQLLTQRIR